MAGHRGEGCGDIVQSVKLPRCRFTRPGDGEAIDRKTVFRMKSNKSTKRRINTRRSVVGLAQFQKFP